MRPYDLVTVGDAFDDLVFADLPRLPRPGEELKTATFLKTVGGGAVITGVAAGRLGLRCAVLTAVGRDGALRLAREPITLVNLLRRGEPPAVSAALSTGRDRAFVTYAGVNDRLEPRLVRAVGRTAGRHVHFALQPAACRTWLALVVRLRSRGITTSWDFGWSERLGRDRDLPALAAALDVLFVNEAEARLYRGVAGRTTIVKCGPRGARWIAADVTESARPPRVRAVDPTGAGDAFNAGFLAAALDGRLPKECLRVGNLVGAESTRLPGGLDGLPGPKALR